MGIFHGPSRSGIKGTHHNLHPSLVEQELEEPTLTKDERSLYRQWLKQLEHFSFIARRAKDGVWDLIVPEDELTPAWVAEYVYTFSQATEEQLDEPYEFLAEPAT